MLDGRSVLDKGYIIQLPAVSDDGSESMTLREVLGYVGAMYGGNWIVNDEGKLQLVPLVPAPETSVLITERGERITIGGFGIHV